jgi:putative ABC transport system substrate-binding protein
MRRREFIAGLGAAAWPLAARAQQPAVPVIGFLNAGSAGRVTNLPAFWQGLKEAGYVEGPNLAVVYRWADSQYDRLPALAADLVNRRVALIFASGGLMPAIAAKAATSTIPIVFQGGGDPVNSGLIASFSRPGGNVTGALNLSSRMMDAKAVEFLRGLVPTASSIGLLMNPSSLNADTDEALAAIRALQWEPHIVHASTEGDMEAAFATFAEQRIGAVHVTADPWFTNHRERIVALAARYAVPTSYPFRDFVVAGGLMSYGADLRESYRLAGTYVGRILKGERPADLPVQQAVKVELVINLKTAKALDLTFPITVLGRADEVIE